MGVRHGHSAFLEYNFDMAIHGTLWQCIAMWHSPSLCLHAPCSLEGGYMAVYATTMYTPLVPGAVAARRPIADRLPMHLTHPTGCYVTYFGCIVWDLRNTLDHFSLQSRIGPCTAT